MVAERGSRKMGDKKQEGELVWRRACPRFSGDKSEYKRWKGQIEDWLDVCGEEVKFPGLEIRMSLTGKALDVTEGLERAELKKETGKKLILDKLDGVFLKDELTENYAKMKGYF